MIVTVDCLACHQAFVYDHVGRGRRRRTCSPACRKARNAASNAVARKRQPKRSEPRPKTLSKVCAVCAQPFMAYDKKRQACGPGCGNVLGKLNGDLGRRRNAEERRRRICEHCGGSFIAHNPSAAARAGRVREGRFCSRNCSAAANRKIACEETSP